MGQTFKSYRKTAAFTRKARRLVQAMVASGLPQASAVRQISAKPLVDVSKLRYQAVFMMGAGGSGKGFVGYRWMKYMPGAPPEGYSRDQLEKAIGVEELSEQSRSLSNLDFESVVAKIRKDHGIIIEPSEGSALIPFRLFDYGPKGSREIPMESWKTELPPEVYKAVQGLTQVVFKTPKHELPSYWRQVDPDLYKKELAGYLATQPGYVHEMSSEMAKSYMAAILPTGDPLFVDGTGSDLARMVRAIQEAKNAGYRISLVLVWVPLTINQIRNATRPRNVPVMSVITQWKIITKNFAALRSVVDKSKLVDNRNDSSDMKLWKQEHSKINQFILRSTNGIYPDLYSLIAKEAPQELASYGRVLSENRE